MAATRTRTWTWHNLVLAALCIGAIVAAALLVGPNTASGTQSRVVTVQRGVVQSSVSGSGNVESANQASLSFKASGQIAHIYVQVGQHVAAGQLLADLDPTSAQVALAQAQANLESAQAKLQQVEANPSSAAASASAPTASAARASAATSAPPARSPTGSGSSGSSGGAGSSGSSAGSTLTPAEQAANLASAQATVASDQLAVASAQRALDETKLYAPQPGTVASISAQVGDQTGPGGGSSANSSSGGSSNAGSAGGGAGSGSAAAAAASSSSNAGSSGNSGSSGFIVLTDLSALQMIVPFSESDIGKVKVGRAATVSVNAVPDQQFAAHVSSIAILPTSSNGVVSYDVTLTLDQGSPALRPGMSATATVIAAEADDAINVPSQAITGSTVTVLRNGKQQRQAIVTGIVGSSTTQVLSGLSVGDQVVVPVRTFSAATGTGTGTAGLGGRFGGLGGGLGGGGGARLFGAGGG